MTNCDNCDYGLVCPESTRCSVVTFAAPIESFANADPLPESFVSEHMKDAETEPRHELAMPAPPVETELEERYRLEREDAEIKARQRFRKSRRGSLTVGSPLNDSEGSP